MVEMEEKLKALLDKIAYHRCILNLCSGNQSFYTEALGWCNGLEEAARIVGISYQDIAAAVYMGTMRANFPYDPRWQSS
jgi:hypothetical protein